MKSYDDDHVQSLTIPSPYHLKCDGPLVLESYIFGEEERGTSGSWGIAVLHNCICYLHSSVYVHKLYMCALGFMTLKPMRSRESMQCAVCRCQNSHKLHVYCLYSHPSDV